MKSRPTPVASIAKSMNYPIYYSDKFNDKLLITKIKQLNPDLFIVVSFKILSKIFLSIPRFGSINIHPSLLPKYRGASPIYYSLMNGDSHTGITIFKLTNNVDAGNILLQKRFNIDKQITHGELSEKLSIIGSKLLVSIVVEQDY